MICKFNLSQIYIEPRKKGEKGFRFRKLIDNAFDNKGEVEYKFLTVYIRYNLYSGGDR